MGYQTEQITTDPLQDQCVIGGYRRFVIGNIDLRTDTAPCFLPNTLLSILSLARTPRNIGPHRILQVCLVTPSFGSHPFVTYLLLSFCCLRSPSQPHPLQNLLIELLASSSSHVACVLFFFVGECLDLFPVPLSELEQNHAFDLVSSTFFSETCSERYLCDPLRAFAFCPDFCSFAQICTI